MSSPIEIDFEVQCSVEHAFLTWTDKIDAWWPADHTVSGHPQAVVMEHGVGGRIFERTTAGEEHEWGEITRWEPPHQLAYLWHLRQDVTDATEVVITFTAQEDFLTRVAIAHHGWERLGQKGHERRMQNQSGWDSLLPHYLQELAKGAN